MSLKFIHILLCFTDNKSPDINFEYIVTICENLDLKHNHKMLKKIIVENFGMNEEDDYNMNVYFILSCNNLGEDNMLMYLKKQKCMLIRLKGKENLQWNSLYVQNSNKFHSLSSHLCTFLFNLMNPANLHDQSATKLDCTI